jgi:hypothetical protein
MSNEETAKEKLMEIANTSDLSVAIKRLESLRFLQEEEIKADFRVILNDLKPANILKKTLHEVQESTPLKHNLLKVAVGLGAGYFSRKMVVGKSAGILKKALGTALQFGVTSLIAKKTDNEDDMNLQGKKKGFLKRLLATKI